MVNFHPFFFNRCWSTFDHFFLTTILINFSEERFYGNCFLLRANCQLLCTIFWATFFHNCRRPTFKNRFLTAIISQPPTATVNLRPLFFGIVVGQPLSTDFRQRFLTIFSDNCWPIFVNCCRPTFMNQFLVIVGGQLHQPFSSDICWSIFIDYFL